MKLSSLISSLLPSTAAREPWKRTLIGAAAWIMAISVLAVAAAIRVSRVPESPVRHAPLLAAGTALITAAGACLLITLIMTGTEALTARFLPGSSKRKDLPEASAALAAALAFLLAGYLGFRILPIPLSLAGHWVFIPLIGKPALSHLTSLFLLLALETGLAVWWIAERRGWPWYLIRAAAGILWCAFLIAVIAGPNPLRGDPLEWAAHLNSPAIHPGWLYHAPRIMQPWWPALRVGIAGAVLVTLLGVFEETREAWRRHRSGD